MASDEYGYIYCIKNKENNKMYIGKSTKVKKRMQDHLCKLRKDKHVNGHLQNSYNKYGKGSFLFEIIEENVKKANLNEREKYWIKFHNTYKEQGYNLTPGGDGAGIGKDNPMYGRKHTKETRKKMSKNHPGSEGDKNPMYGKTSEENPMYGADLAGNKNPFYGKRHTKTTKEKMSKNHADVKGRKHPRCKTNIKFVKKIIKEYFNTGQTQKDMAKKYNISQKTISRICRGNHWTYRESEKLKELLINIKKHNKKR